MPHQTNGIPPGFHTVTPYLIFKDAARAIEFYQTAFGATLLFRLAHPDGKIQHAEIKIGDSPVMMVDENPKFPEMRSTQSLGGSPVHIHLYVADVDAFVQRAVAAGATALGSIEDTPDGERRGGLQDPFGLTWWIATATQNITRDELQKRYDDLARNTPPK